MINKERNREREGFDRENGLKEKGYQRGGVNREGSLIEFLRHM